LKVYNAISKYLILALPNGMVFVVRLLAFRFVKKAETEILSEKKGFIPLATIAFSICKKCPEWGSLVQAYFYKLCPFLVPFSFPREQLSLQEYCSSLGYELKGSDSTVLTEMVARVKGYKHSLLLLYMYKDCKCFVSLQLLLFVRFYGNDL
jgi:hypothetical protein